MKTPCLHASVHDHARSFARRDSVLPQLPRAVAAGFKSAVVGWLYYDICENPAAAADYFGPWRFAAGAAGLAIIPGVSVLQACLRTAGLIQYAAEPGMPPPPFPFNDNGREIFAPSALLNPQTWGRLAQWGETLTRAAGPTANTLFVDFEAGAWMARFHTFWSDENRGRVGALYRAFARRMLVQGVRLLNFHPMIHVDYIAASGAMVRDIIPRGSYQFCAMFYDYCDVAAMAARVNSAYAAAGLPWAAAGSKPAFTFDPGIASRWTAAQLAGLKTTHPATWKNAVLFTDTHNVSGLLDGMDAAASGPLLPFPN